MFGILTKYAVFLALINLVFSESIFCFGNNSDTALARNYYDKANSAFENSQFDTSVNYFEKSGQLWESVGLWENYLKCKMGIGKNYVRKGDANSALILLNQALAVSQEKLRTQCDELGDIAVLIGYVYSLTEQYDDAIKKTLNGIAIYNSIHGEVNQKVIGAYYTLGIAWLGKGEYDKSIDAMDKTRILQIKFKGEYSLELSNTLTMLGAVYDAKNQFDKAIDNYIHSLKIFEQHGMLQSSDAAVCYIYLMSSYINKGDYSEAIEHGKKAIKIYTNLLLPEHINVAGAYDKLGEIYTSIGDFEKAKEYLEQSLQIFSSRHPEKQSAIGKLYQHLSDMYRQTGDLSNALSYSLKGVTILESAFGELHPEIGYMYEQIAGIYSDLKKYNEAVSYYHKAIAARKNVGKTSSRTDLAALYSSIAGVYINRKKPDSAFVHLNTASTYLSESSQKNIPLEALLYKRYGDAYLLRKEYHKALDRYQHAAAILTGNESSDTYVIPSFENCIYKKDLLEIVLQKGLTFEQMYSKKKSLKVLSAAMHHYELALELIDEVRKRYSTDMSKYYLAEKSNSIYGNACRVALSLYAASGEEMYKEKAFLIADRSKANVLLEKLFSEEAKQFAGIPDSLLLLEKSLLRDIAYHETKVQKADVEHGANLSTVQARLFDLKTQHQQLVEFLEAQYPKYYALKYAQYSVSLKDIRNNLPANSVFIEYFVDQQSTYAFCISRRDLSVTTLPGTDVINRQVEQFTNALKKYDNEGYVKSGTALYFSLLAPLQRTLSATSSLIIVPDGNLCRVPFEALPVYSPADKSAPNFSTLPYVISRYAVNYSYSAAFYLKMHTEQRQFGGVSAQSFAGFAPVFRDSMKNGDFLANRSYVEESGIGDVRSITLNGKTFNELKYSEDEIVSIGNEFNNHALPYKNFLHTSATESNFKKFAGTYDILHVATHGYINEQNPKFSAIIFSQPQAPTEDDDGILHVNETFNLGLRANLVVLSSCESGVGKLVKGEGMIALTRGLFYAGAKNIIFSLWKVSDKHTYLLMDEFYKQLLSGKTYSSALRAAKLKMISSADSAFPAKWSGFVLVGE